MHDAGKLRVLVLSKRQYMSRDLITDRYGRFREIPLELAAAGHQVKGVCLSYRPRMEGVFRDDRLPARVEWTSLNLPRLVDLGSSGYLRTIDRVAERLQPQFVWACSDVPHAVLGVSVAKRLGTRLIVDLYDNFESYPLARVPFVTRAFRDAVRSADGVTCVSSPLMQRIRDTCHFTGPITVIENAVPQGIFEPSSRAHSRTAFGLPAIGTMIGTAGALSVARGTQFLIEAFEAISRERKDLHLVLAGPLDRRLRLPRSEQIHYLGLLPPEQVPSFLAALDVSVICNRDSAFGRYCFPQKLYESLGCNIPVAVAGVGAMSDLLAEYPGSLYRPDDVASLVETLHRQIAQPVVPRLEIPTWESQAGKLSTFMRDMYSQDNQRANSRV